MDRRTVITAAVALPCIGVAGSATATPGNATDAAWSAYEAAKANYETHDQAYDAFETAIPIGPRPRFDDFENRDEWESLADQWEQERAKHPANPFDLDDAALDALCEPVSNAEKAVLATPATTLTDVERKLAVVSGWSGGNEIPAEFVDGILADVRSLNREGAS